MGAAGEWAASRWSRMFGRSGHWTLTVDGPSAVVDIGDGTRAVPLAALRDRHADRGTLWCAMTLRSAGATLVLDGIHGVWRVWTARWATSSRRPIASRDSATPINATGRSWLRGGRPCSPTPSAKAAAGLRGTRSPAGTLPGRRYRRMPFLAVCEEPRLAAFRDEQPGALREAVDAWSAVDLPRGGRRAIRRSLRESESRCGSSSTPSRSPR